MRVDIALFASSLTVLGPTVGVGVATRIAEQPSSAAAAHATQALPHDTWHQLLDAFVAMIQREASRLDVGRRPSAKPRRRREGVELHYQVRQLVRSQAGG